MKKILVLLIIAFISMSAFAKVKPFVSIDDLKKMPLHYTSQNGELHLQRNRADIARIVGYIEGEKYEKNPQSDNIDIEKVVHYLSLPHPSVKVIDAYFKDASKEFGVPVELLRAIAQVESNWTQYGPSLDQGWGIMHLVSNNYSNTLDYAAKLLGVPSQMLKDNARMNIRGAAAVMADLAQYAEGDLNTLEAWFPVAEQFSALRSPVLRELQAKTYFEKIRDGANATTLWNETVTFEGVNIDVQAIIEKRRNTALLEQHMDMVNVNFIQAASVDYPGAVPAFASCNYTSGRSASIDTWTNHWIGVGTYAGAISWLQNCDADASAHFVIRASDGEIAQLVKVSDTAWHAGASGYNNNSRSIGVEHEATASNPDLWYSTPMLTASAELARYFADIYGIPHQLHTVPGIAGHNEMPGTSTECPGNLPWDTWMDYFLGNNDNGGNDDGGLDGSNRLFPNWKPGCALRRDCF